MFWAVVTRAHISYCQLVIFFRTDERVYLTKLTHEIVRFFYNTKKKKINLKFLWWWIALFHYPRVLEVWYEKKIEVLCTLRHYKGLIKEKKLRKIFWIRFRAWEKWFRFMDGSWIIIISEVAPSLNRFWKLILSWLNR